MLLHSAFAVLCSMEITRSYTCSFINQWLSFLYHEPHVFFIDPAENRISRKPCFGRRKTFKIAPTSSWAACGRFFWDTTGSGATTKQQLWSPTRIPSATTTPTAPSRISSSTRTGPSGRFSLFAPQISSSRCVSNYQALLLLTVFSLCWGAPILSLYCCDYL